MARRFAAAGRFPGLLLLLLMAPPAAVAVPAADWTLETHDGRSVTFSERLAAGPVLVGFWATWCRPCLKELPHLEALADEFGDRMTFLAVNADGPRSVAKVPGTLQSLGVRRLTVPLDTGGALQQLLQTGGVLPFLVVFDAAGREVYRHTGYKEGDELELRRRLELLLAAAPVPASAATAGSAAAGVVTASDQFEYSYAEDTAREIFDNWLDLGTRAGPVRVGVTLRSEAPGETGRRRHEITHRFAAYADERIEVRAGHFYGLFGRGLIFNAVEDRVVRIDTPLDGLTATLRRGRWAATVFSGTPPGRPDDPAGSAIDVRGLDLGCAPLPGLRLGAGGLTYRPDDFTGQDGAVHREWAAAVRAGGRLGCLEAYLERGWKRGYDFDPTRPGAEPGRALYANLNLDRGPWSLSWEMSDYRRFWIIQEADGTTALNRPPSLAREFAWTLPNRAPHNLDADDERGHDLDVGYGNDRWRLLASAVRLERHDGGVVYESLFGSFQKERVGPLRAAGGFGYQESEGLRQTVVGELVWRSGARSSWTLQAEHQHVRLGGGRGYDLGAYDQQWFKLEYETAPRWAFAAVLETNNKVAAQRPGTERAGPFPAAQITYALDGGGSLGLWAGKRQAGYLCSGGLCKVEPAFAGLELTGTLRY